MSQINRPIVFAHRGASKTAPENTMAAFEKAVESGADGIELDIQITHDKKLVVLHDEVLGRTSTGYGMIKDLEYSYLKSLDFGSWFSPEYQGEKIPLLTQVLDFVKDKKIVLNIEIKRKNVTENNNIETELARILSEYKDDIRIIISSFDHFILKRLKQQKGDLCIAPLYASGFLDIWQYAKEIKADAVHPAFNLIDEDSIINCQKEGVDVNVWNVDDDCDIKKAVNMGVNGIITNYPQKVLSIIRDFLGRT